MKKLPKVLRFFFAVGFVYAAANGIVGSEVIERQTAPDANTKRAISEADRLVHPVGKPPFPYKDLGANWQYTNDFDKLPLFRRAFETGKLRKYFFKPDNDPMCQIFPIDFVKGKFKVINPEYEALSNDDPRLGTPPTYSNPLPASEPPRYKGPTNWRRCDWAETTDSTAMDPRMVFQSLWMQGEPPYRIYRLNDEDGSRMDIALVREDNSLKPPKWKVDGYGQDYLWVNLNGCEIISAIAALSPQASMLDGLHQDGVSLLIRYSEKPLVLSYMNWAKRGEPDLIAVSLDSFYQDPAEKANPKPREICEWAFPGTFN